MTPIRVLLLCRHLDSGGSERQLAAIARFLDRTRFDPRVGCFVEGGMRAAELQEAGVPVVQFPVHSYKSPAAIARGASSLVHYIRQQRIDIVHTFDYPTTVFAIPVTRWFTASRAVSSQRSHRDLVPAGYRKVLRLTDHVAHGIVVNCGYLEKHLIEDEHVPTARIHVCSNGLNLDTFSPSPVVRSASVANVPLTIGVVSGLHKWKGLGTLLEAFARVQPMQPGMKLVFVGGGAYLSDLQSRAAALNLAADCVFAPAQADVTDWLRSIDIFVLPSLSEAMSNALMEAMACGCCAVASDVGGNPELVHHLRTGMLFPPGDSDGLATALKLLIEKPELRRSLAAEGTRYIRENFSVQAAASRMGEIYANLLSKPAGRPQPAETAAPR